MPGLKTVRTRIIDCLEIDLQPFSKEGTQCDVDTVIRIRNIVEDILNTFERGGEVENTRVSINATSKHVIEVEAYYELGDPVEHITVDIVINITQPSFGSAFDRAMKGI